MPDPRDDLIRRGDVLKLGAEWPSGLIEPDDVEALPADHVAAAALALAEAYLGSQDEANEKFAILGITDTRAYLKALVGTNPSSEKLFDAADRYRSAVAGREAGR